MSCPLRSYPTAEPAELVGPTRHAPPACRMERCPDGCTASPGRRLRTALQAVAEAAITWELPKPRCSLTVERTLVAATPAGDIWLESWASGQREATEPAPLPHLSDRSRRQAVPVQFVSVIVGAITVRRGRAGSLGPVVAAGEIATLDGGCRMVIDNPTARPAHILRAVAPAADSLRVVDASGRTHAFVPPQPFEPLPQAERILR